MKYVLFYESPDMAKAMDHYPAHKARLDEFAARGTHDDPFLLNGVVSSWHIREWDA